MMRVLHYIPSIDRTSGGTTAYLQLLAKELGLLTELHIVTHESDNPVEMEHSCVHRIADFRHPGRMKRQWRDLIDGLQPDVVHVNCCWMPGCALVQRWAQQAGYKVVLSPHGMLEPWILARHYWTRKVPALWLYQKRAVVRADCLHATAESERANLLRLGYNSRVKVIANGIDVEGIRLKSSWTRTGSILFLSRIHVKKGIEYLIEAVAALRKELEGYVVRIAGEGDAGYIEQLKERCRTLEVAERIEFCGGVYGEEKWRLFREADLFVLPTHSENFGIVVAEALACGTPVVTTQGTPWQELESRHCGWWTKVGTEATEAALRSFLAQSADELEVMGRNGRQLVEEKYSARKMAEEMVRLYRGV